MKALKWIGMFKGLAVIFLDMKCWTWSHEPQLISGMQSSISMPPSQC